MLIKNINGTGERIPNLHNSWIEFWEAKTGQISKNGVGGHVRKVNSSDNAWYIADITPAQNNKTEPYEYDGVLAKLRD